MAAANGNNGRCAGLTALLQENKTRCNSGGGDMEIHGFFLTGYRQLSSEIVASFGITALERPRSQDLSDTDGRPNEVLKKTSRGGNLEQISRRDVGFQRQVDLIGFRIKMNPNRSDLWWHRCSVCEKLGSDAVSELMFTKEILYLDSKNEMAWFHRKWVLERFGGWENELAFCSELLQRDICNEYAWEQRFFAVLRCGVGIAEIDYASEAILKFPENEYSWKYLRRLYEEIKSQDGKLDVGVDRQQLIIEVDHKFDPLFLRVTDTKCVFDSTDLNYTKRKSFPDDIKMNIAMHQPKYLYAMKTLLYFVILGYRPRFTVVAAVGHLCPSNEKISKFIEQVRSILECADELKTPHWRSCRDKVRKMRVGWPLA